MKFEWWHGLRVGEEKLCQMVREMRDDPEIEAKLCGDTLLHRDADGSILVCRVERLVKK